MYVSFCYIYFPHRRQPSYCSHRRKPSCCSHDRIQERAPRVLRCTLQCAKTWKVFALVRTHVRCETVCFMYIVFVIYAVVYLLINILIRRYLYLFSCIYTLRAEENFLAARAEPPSCCSHARIQERTPRALRSTLQCAKTWKVFALVRTHVRCE